MPLIQSSLRLLPNPDRVVVRPLHLAPKPRDINPVNNDRVRRIIAAVRAMDGRTTQAELALVLADFESRHREIRRVFEERYDQVASEIGLADPLDRAQRQLIGAYFCHEYSFGAAAVMNPSIVPHPDQTGLTEGALRFILSLRAVGEGHISSVTFRQGIVRVDGTIELDPAPDLAVAAKAESQPDGSVVFRRHDCSNRLDEMVLFPFTPAQRNGLEDLRLVRFEDDDGNRAYYGTYTAYSGAAIASEILLTRDFEAFELRALQGSAARNKGMALFPRKFDGDYLMVGRQDGESLYLLRSPDLYRWERGELLARPEYAWELIQIGNCGAPIELEEGWLVLTHGVGAMRKYSIGALLLDREDPSCIIGRTAVPLLSPSDEAREGYVPNVVYTCGALAHAGRLIMPYGVADSSVSFASIDLAELLAMLCPPSVSRSSLIRDFGQVRDRTDA
ncbi:glycoside hydrolase family 130 protein [Sphingobium yanoikuyae]|uniref:glycoside hydrolase family 130 protein n=1 Tax=Sphingobium TaxID=165695 RepID=UPI000C080EC6|nr:glycoside hydrolase family 130 protein [Sphingobium sp. IP1]PHP20764.1 glycosidase [Sphingobium sp. IP1]